MTKKSKQTDWETFNAGKPWTDEDVEIVLRQAPTSENCRVMGRLLGRSYSAIHWIYQLSPCSKEELKDCNQWANIFVRRVYQVSRKISLIRPNPGNKIRLRKTA
jgi:hypothetical protein